MLIGLCWNEIKGHRDHKTFMSFPPLPYFHHNNEYYSPDFLPPFKNGPIPPPQLGPPQPPQLPLSQFSQLPYKSPTFPPLIHDNILPPPPFLPNMDFGNFPFQPLPLQQNFPLDFNQNYLNNYYYFPYDTNVDTRDEFVGLKAPIQIIPSRFPPRIEALIERIQNYFSTYNQIDGQRPDYDPNIKPPLIIPPPEVAVPVVTESSIGNVTEVTETKETTTPEPITTTISPGSSSTTKRSVTKSSTTTEKGEETTSESEESENEEEPEPLGPIEITINKTESEDDNKTEENHENEEPGEETSGETFTEETEETTTERRNEETTENDVEVEVITLEKKKPDSDKR